MAREIERKFLVEELPGWLEKCERAEIEQGYLAIEADAEVRLRRAGEELTLTVKRGEGEDRGEYEVALAPEQMDSLWEACAGRRLRKRRYLVPLDDDLRAEVDVYAGALQGLRVAEVEFPSAERAAAFRPPAWFGRELTGVRRFANQALAVEGMPEGIETGARAEAGDGG
jgi:adenylate cyclase